MSRPAPLAFVGSLGRRTACAGLAALALAALVGPASGDTWIAVEETRLAGKATDLALSGDTFANVAGQVYVRTGSTWTLQQVLPGGETVDLHGDQIVHGLGYAIAIRQRTAGTWGAPVTIYDDCFGHTADFGTDVWMGRDAQGELLCVGSGYDLDTCGGPGIEEGAAYGFRHDGVGWPHSGTCAAGGYYFGLPKASCAGTVEFGLSVAASGNTILVLEGKGGGAAHVFTGTGNTWAQVGRLHPDQNELAPFRFASQALSIDGDTAVVAAEGIGIAWAFERAPNGTWSPQLLAGPGDGNGVAVDGDLLAVGVPAANQVLIFERGASGWEAAGTVDAPTDHPFVNFGHSVDLEGTRLAVGSTGPSSPAVLYELVPAATSYCTSGTTANGCRATMSGSGVPSATAGSGFDLRVLDVEGQKSGIVFYGVAGRAASPWGMGGTSWLCVKAPTQRTTLLSSGGTAGACDGVLSLDWNAWIAAHPSALGQPFVGGETVQAQGWFRDLPSVKSTSLSDGLEFVVCP